VVLALGLAAAIVVLMAGTTRQKNASPQPLGIPGRWHLVLDSEFNGTRLPVDWKAGWLASGVTRPVNSYEHDCYSPSNVTFPGDGSMHLNVTAAPSVCAGVRRSFTGALVSTDPNHGRGAGFQYTYGVVQARVYLPAEGAALADWPAVWADGQNWPTDGEDDIVEGIDGQACFHFHDSLGGPGRCLSSFSPGWHTFASDWQKGSVTYYYDGVEVGSITSGITSDRMFLLLNNTTTAHRPIADSMRVQYVRVWQ
jgi:beta-glucanase (GH16 family)